MNIGKEFVRHFPRISPIFVSSKRVQITVTYGFEPSYSSSSWAGLVKTTKLSTQLLQFHKTKRREFLSRKIVFTRNLLLLINELEEKYLVQRLTVDNPMKTPISTSC